jgi:hypothetical protein
MQAKGVLEKLYSQCRKARHSCSAPQDGPTHSVVVAIGLANGRINPPSSACPEPRRRASQIFSSLFRTNLCSSVFICVPFLLFALSHRSVSYSIRVPSLPSCLTPHPSNLLNTPTFLTERQSPGTLAGKGRGKFMTAAGAGTEPFPRSSPRSSGDWSAPTSQNGSTFSGPMPGVRKDRTAILI